MHNQKTGLSVYCAVNLTYARCCWMHSMMQNSPVLCYALTLLSAVIHKEANQHAFLPDNTIHISLSIWVQYWRNARGRQDPHGSRQLQGSHGEVHPGCLSQVVVVVVDLSDLVPPKTPRLSYVWCRTLDDQHLQIFTQIPHNNSWHKMCTGPFG